MCNGFVIKINNFYLEKKVRTPNTIAIAIAIAIVMKPYQKKMMGHSSVAAKLKAACASPANSNKINRETLVQSKKNFKFFYICKLLCLGTSTW